MTTAYVARRLLSALPSVVIVSIIIFSLVRLLPGDVVMARVADGGFYSKEDLDLIRADLGLDRNFFAQYVTWAGGLLRGDMGTSLWSTNEVTSMIRHSMLLSIELTLLSMVVALAIAIPLGVLSAVKQDSWIDYLARLFSVLGLSVPDFWLATMVLLGFSKYVGWLPQFGWFAPWDDPWRNVQALIFPALIIGYRFSAVTARMTRSALLEVLREDYVRTARAKGLPERTVILRHALRNALIPVITIVGTQVGFLFGGLVVIEFVFGLPGMGQLTYDAVVRRDYPVVQGTVMVMALVFIMANLAVDLSYSLLDPRIRYA